MPKEQRPTPRQIADRIIGDLGVYHDVDSHGMADAIVAAIKEERRIIQRLTLALRRKRGA